VRHRTQCRGARTRAMEQAVPRFMGDAVALHTDPGIAIPLLLIKPRDTSRRFPVVLALAHDEKTGVPVHIPLPPFVVDALVACPRKSERYWFWTGVGSKETLSGSWRRTFRRLCKLANVRGAILIDSGTRLRWNCCSKGCRWSGSRSCWAIAR
jgi:hypothetical protein